MAALRLFVRFGYVPTMLVGFNLVAVYLMASGYSVLWIGALFGISCYFIALNGADPTLLSIPGTTLTLTSLRM